MKVAAVAVMMALLVGAVPAVAHGPRHGGFFHVGLFGRGRGHGQGGGGHPINAWMGGHHQRLR